jgi:DNA-directed RNA polymerase subunit omega
MPTVATQELLKQCPSIYKLVVVAARRAKELNEGAPQLVEIDTKKVTTIALEEIRQGKIQIQMEELDGHGTKPRSAKKGTAKRKKK